MPHIINVFKLSGIMNLLMGGLYTIICCQTQPSDTYTIHRYHHFIQPVYSYSEDPGGGKSREHVYEVEYSGAPLSKRQILPNALSVKLQRYQNVMRQIGSSIKLGQ